MVPEQFKLDIQPVASENATICVGKARFTVLTERLVRLEYDPAEQFEDRASQTMWYRQQAVPDFTVQRDDAQITIETRAFSLRYAVGQPFTPESLSVHVKDVDAMWHPGDVNTGNLKGTTRTLDVCNGYTPLSDGLISRDGWALLDDSQTFVFNEDYWLEPRNGQTVDWYFFAYGHDYKVGLRDYCTVSGNAPLIPRWILGNWWSRYWHYTQEEFETLIQEFEAHEIPLSVCIIDMDWHVTETGNTSTGWTGYTWNRELFPDPQGMIDFFHEKGLRTAMNLHPAEGIHPHEAQYVEMAQRMGIDPATQQPVEFDITDPKFVEAYFDVLHHPYEKMGVDFWWLDWQQGLSCKIPGLDPLWFINHLHFQDAGRDLSHRPFIFSRWGNEGHQRYPIGFSGDSYITWDTLRFESYMTPTASNVAYGWWSHDIGGHTSGTGDGELFARWVQFGVFSPIMRIHTTKGYFYDQRPWMFESKNVQETVRDTMQLRHALIPYLYTMAWRAHGESLPLMLPMYYDYPEEEAAYHCPYQYLFGTELIAAPFVDPIDPDTRLSRQVIWLPKGSWYNVFTGEHFEGDRWHAIYGTLEDIPLFAKAGAILPMGPQSGENTTANPDELHIHIFAGADNSFTLYEDDGDSRAYLNGDFCTTTITTGWKENALTVSINPAEGNTSLIPAERSIHLYLHGVKESVEIAVQVDGAVASTASTYDAETETLHLEGIRFAPTAALAVRFDAHGTLLAHRDRKREKLIKMLRSFRLIAGVRNRLADMVDELIADPDQIAPFLVSMQETQIRALCEVLYEAGLQFISDTHDPVLLILWNNNEDQAITYRYGDAYLHFGFLKGTNHHNGVVPRFMVLTPEMQTWSHGALNEHVRRTQWRVQMDYHNLATVMESDVEEIP